MMKIFDCTVFFYYESEERKEKAYYIMKAKDDSFILEINKERYPNDDFDHLYEYKAHKVSNNRYEVFSLKYIGGDEKEESWQLLTDGDLDADSYIYGKWESNQDVKEDGMVVLDLN